MVERRKCGVGEGREKDRERVERVESTEWCESAAAI
jgi:hypothetical protein